MKERSPNMKRLFYFVALTICSVIVAYLLIWLALPLLQWPKNPAIEKHAPGTYEWYIEHEYRYAECNRRIRDQEYIAGTWYHADPNVIVYLDLIEQEGWSEPVLHYTASDPNATIYLYQQLLMNTSGEAQGGCRGNQNPSNHRLELERRQTVRPDIDPPRRGG